MNTLIEGKTIKWKELGGGIKRKIMAYNATMMLVKIDYERFNISCFL